MQDGWRSGCRRREGESRLVVLDGECGLPQWSVQMLGC